MKLFKHTHRAENATLTEVGLLVHIAQNVDASGLYQYKDSDTANATDSTKPTVQRLRQRLTQNGYLFERIPSKYLGRDGWTTVGVEITPKGFKRIVLNSKMSQALTLTQKTTSADSNESLTTIYSKSVIEKIGVESDSIGNLGITPDESGSLQRLTAENILLFREIDYQQRLLGTGIRSLETDL